MLSKEEIENNRIPKQLEKILGIEKEDIDILIAFKENLFEKTIKENIELKKQVEQLESDKQKLIDKLEEDNKQDKEKVMYYERARRECKNNSSYKKIYQNIINCSNAKIKTRKEILSMLKGENE